MNDAYLTYGKLRLFQKHIFKVGSINKTQVNTLEQLYEKDFKAR